MRKQIHKKNYYISYSNEVDIFGQETDETALVFDKENKQQGFGTKEFWILEGNQISEFENIETLEEAKKHFIRLIQTNKAIESSWSSRE